jgi:hypothetical protein
MKLRSRLPALLLALDWLLLLLAFGWTCKVQHNVLWWLRLDWTGWLGEFGELAQLGTLSAGTLWILWLALTLLLTAVALLVPRETPEAAVITEASADAARKQLATNSSLMDSDPVLKEKLLRLHQSLDKL